MRRTWLIEISIGVLLMAVVGASRASQPQVFGPGQFTILGEGHSTCETWRVGRKMAEGTPEHTRTAQMRHWMQGYVSASAWDLAKGPEEQKLTLKNIDVEALDVRMDEICAANPRITFWQACSTLVGKLTLKVK
jgi:hypothetical protein